jgi:predicted component of type VI protein secretion system
MNEETFNLSIRKFLKMVGVNSQREIERAVAAALEQRKITGTEALSASVTLAMPGIGLSVTFDDEIRLQ